MDIIDQFANELKEAGYTINNVGRLSMGDGDVDFENPEGSTFHVSVDEMGYITDAHGMQKEGAEPEDLMDLIGDEDEPVGFRDFPHYRFINW